MPKPPLNVKQGIKGFIPTTNGKTTPRQKPLPRGRACPECKQYIQPNHLRTHPNITPPLPNSASCNTCNKAIPIEQTKRNTWKRMFGK